MLEYLYNYVFVALDSIGLNSLLLAMFGDRSLVDVPLWDFLSVLFTLVCTFLALVFVVKFFFSLIRKFLEVDFI